MSMIEALLLYVGDYYYTDPVVCYIAVAFLLLGVIGFVDIFYYVISAFNPRR